MIIIGFTLFIFSNKKRISLTILIYECNSASIIVKIIVNICKQAGFDIWLCGSNKIIN